MSNLWFFRLRSGSNPPPNQMDRRRSSSERVPILSSTNNNNSNDNNNKAQKQVIVDLDHNFRPFSKTIPSDRISGGGGGDGNQTTTMSRIQSARSSTASYCGVQYGTTGAAGGGGIGTFHIYGDVPPLHRRSFLSSNPQASDSLDNVAQLIPRYHYHYHFSFFLFFFSFPKQGKISKIPATNKQTTMLILFDYFLVVFGLEFSSFFSRRS